MNIIANKIDTMIHNQDINGMSTLKTNLSKVLVNVKTLLDEWDNDPMAILAYLGRTDKMNAHKADRDAESIEMHQLKLDEYYELTTHINRIDFFLDKHRMV